jgi:hypothetical protein
MNGSGSVVLESVRIGVSKTTGNGKGVCRAHTPKETNVKYTTSVEFKGRGPEAEVLVTCSCPDHMYRWEVALTKKGGSKVLYSNGEKPVVQNPKELSGCCKHVFAFIKLLQRKGVM